MIDGAVPISINGEELYLLKEAAAFAPKHQALLVADLHFEKGSSYAPRGIFLPPYDTRATLQRLKALTEKLRPKTIVSLGDAFHDRGSDERMNAADAVVLANMIDACDWVWVLGNHDPVPSGRFAGRACVSMRLGGLFLTHEPDEAIGIAGAIAGHLHPCAKIKTAQSALRRRCFALGADCMVMPAFGAYTGGLNVLDEAFDGFLQSRQPVCAIGAEGVYPISTSRLLADRRLPQQCAG